MHNRYIRREALLTMSFSKARSTACPRNTASSLGRR